MRVDRYVRQFIFIQILNVLELHFRGQNSNRVHWEVNIWLSHELWQIIQKLVMSTDRKLLVVFLLAYLHLNLAHSKDQGQGCVNFDCGYLANDDRLYKHCKSHVAFWSAYLHLTLAYSKRDGQGHAHFDYEYLSNDDRTNITIANTKSHVYSLLIEIFVWSWPIVKVKFKIRHILIVHIFQMVSDRTNIAIARNWKLLVTFLLACLQLSQILCCVSICIFRVDLDLM